MRLEQDDLFDIPDASQWVLFEIVEAIRLVRDNSRFLGRTTEIGQAIDATTFRAHQCCYVCQGMMGYKNEHIFVRDFSLLPPSHQQINLGHHSTRQSDYCSPKCRRRDSRPRSIAFHDALKAALEC
ncbi:hypothetical protein PHISP_03823 [Aspergillus sp. HF37]|nr:hypothetical protein PHISP_03823 [Aspergillus sp. HF37]